MGCIGVVGGFKGEETKEISIGEKREQRKKRLFGNGRRTTLAPKNALVKRGKPARGD